jgi:hypothetical protein
MTGHVFDAIAAGAASASIAATHPHRGLSCMSALMRIGTSFGTSAHCVLMHARVRCP